MVASQKHLEPHISHSRTLHCSSGSLPITYLGIPISGGRPRKQDWDILLSKIRSRLASWKSKLLSLGGRLTLVNSVLTAIPTYWMSLFRLPVGVAKSIDKIRRDFLWSGPDTQHNKIRLVNWMRLCRSTDQGGWDILNLQTFNSALLGKWWWKIASGLHWCGEAIIRENYFKRAPHGTCSKSSVVDVPISGMASFTRYLLLEQTSPRLLEMGLPHFFGRTIG